MCSKGPVLPAGWADWLGRRGEGGGGGKGGGGRMQKWAQWADMGGTGGMGAWPHQQSVCEEELLGRVAHVGEREEAGAHERAQHIGTLRRVCRIRHLDRQIGIRVHNSHATRFRDAVSLTTQTPIYRHLLDSVEELCGPRLVVERTGRAAHDSRARGREARV